MNRLPEPTPTAPAAGQPTPDALTAAADLAAAVDAIYHGPTSYRDDTKPPAIGPTPPVPQPGTRRPPMSQKATDASALMLSAGAATLPLGAAATGVLWASGYADPTVIAAICAAPVALAIPVLALSRLVKRAKQTVEAAPATIHQHYNGAVYQDQRSIHTQTSGVWASTRNEIPR
ncbi:hypothetical protein ACFC08_28240 [Streptomyces sp. NPDC056112]|uniref:hypothetical protein n=1 Tax=Streptomyces sp. NPDC056112 TaxID=3345715 RepID=UPI0035D71C66